MDHGNDQPLVAGRHGDPQVDPITRRRTRFFKAGVQDRVLAERVDTRARDDRKRADPKRAARDFDAAHVDLDERVAVRRRPQRMRHPLGDRLSHPRGCWFSRRARPHFTPRSRRGLSRLNKRQHVALGDAPVPACADDLPKVDVVLSGHAQDDRRVAPAQASRRSPQNCLDLARHPQPHRGLTPKAIVFIIRADARMSSTLP